MYSKTMVTNKETLQKIRESPTYRAMYRDIIKTQIQTLIDQLAYTGEESVLLTACLVDKDDENTIVGTELGHEFLNLGDTLFAFKDFCVKNVKDRSAYLEAASSSKRNGSVTGKRKFSEMNGDDGQESSEAEQTTTTFMESKRSRSLTPSVKIDTEDSKTRGSNSDVFVPKGYSKCSLCDYMSKFKANVTRHEKGVHRINLENSAMIMTHYTCGLCEYKSTYRSNVMRHEKSIHKVTSTPAELESRKKQFFDNGDGSSFALEPDTVQYETEAGNHSISDDGNQSFLSQTGTSVETFENQSFNWKVKKDEQVKEEPIQFSTETENQTKNDDGNQPMNENSPSMEPDLQGNDAVEDGCHICNHCHLMFSSLSKLRTHVEETHFEKGNFVCEKCKLAFDNEIKLQIHMSTHTASKQEVCKCGKAFQYRTSLIRHERKCEFLTTSQEKDTQGENSEANMETSPTLNQSDSVKKETTNGEFETMSETC